MSLAELVASLQVDGDAVVALAGAMALGIFALTQALKVLGVLTDPVVTGRIALVIGGAEGALVVAAYFFPAFVPVGMIVYATVLAVSAAANGYQYLAKPFLSRLFPGASFSSEDLSPE